MLKRRKYRQSIARSSRAFVAFLREAAVVGASALGILPLYAYQFDPFASPPSRVKLQLSRVTLQSSLDHAAEGTPNADFAEETTIPIKDWVTELLRVVSENGSQSTLTGFKLWKQRSLMRRYHER
ncbi:MAG: hypothetical protein JWQ49_749 [Edaphobacter sp.]|nr:hypothetical protein [Edaphobacter sp.]